VSSRGQLLALKCRKCGVKMSGPCIEPVCKPCGGVDSVVIQLIKKPPKPEPRFHKGDTVRANDEPFSPYVVTEVIQEWVGGEWREYISFKSKAERGAGNADLFYRSKAAQVSRKAGGP
jgi:hypothetical protein